MQPWIDTIGNPVVLSLGFSAAHLFPLRLDAHRDGTVEEIVIGQVLIVTVLQSCHPAGIGNRSGAFLEGYITQGIEITCVT
jgi:hypothetical protein